MHHDKNATGSHADQNIAIFTIVLSIIEKLYGEGISENCACFVETDIVFLKIRCGLGFIPFEFTF